MRLGTSIFVSVTVLQPNRDTQPVHRLCFLLFSIRALRVQVVLLVTNGFEELCFFFVEIQKVHIIFEIRTFHQICGRGPSLQAGSNGVFGLVWNLLEPKLFEF